MKRLPSKISFPVSRRRILAAIATDYTSGMTIREIGTKYDLSYGTARNWVLLSGVPFRPQGGYQKKEKRESELRTQDQ